MFKQQRKQFETILLHFYTEPRRQTVIILYWPKNIIFPISVLLHNSLICFFLIKVKTE
jgi:hypothetical protein